jgi:hypothetical protein
MPVADHMLKMAVAHAGCFPEASMVRHSASLLQRELGGQRRLRCLKMPQRVLSSQRQGHAQHGCGIAADILHVYEAPTAPPEA